MSFQRSLVVILGAWKSLFGAVKLSFPSSRAVAVPGRGWSDCRVNGVRPGRAVVQNRRVTTLFLIVGFSGRGRPRGRKSSLRTTGHCAWPRMSGWSRCSASRILTASVTCC